MKQTPTLVELLKAGVHFGHQSSRWHPKMEQYIFGTKNGIHVINLEKTVEELEKAYTFTKNMVAQGKMILFVGTKRQARDIVKAAAEEAGMPFVVERWIGGLLTNFEECKRRLKKFKQLREQVATGEIEKYTKKEQTVLKKQLEKMEKYLNGLVLLENTPDALYIADMRVEKTAVTEARKTNIPVIGVCDTNVDPSKATCVIPANDDAINSIKLIADVMVEAVKEGRAEWEKKKQAMAKEAPATPVADKKERRAFRKEESI
jgi:small subunit ribosomal protein S2